MRPVWHEGVKELAPFRAMIGMEAMNEFVANDIIDLRRARSDKVDIQDQVPFWREAPPPASQLPNDEFGPLESPSLKGREDRVQPLPEKGTRFQGVECG